MVSPAGRKEAVERLREQVDVSERRACQVLGQPRSTQRYPPRSRDRDRKLVATVARVPRIGERLERVDD